MPYETDPSSPLAFHIDIDADRDAGVALTRPDADGARMIVVTDGRHAGAIYLTPAHQAELAAALVMHLDDPEPPPVQCPGQTTLEEQIAAVADRYPGDTEGAALQAAYGDPPAGHFANNPPPSDDHNRTRAAVDLDHLVASRGVRPPAQADPPRPCGGCGATTDAHRCIGCMHDFGTPESAWVRRSRSGRLS